jgi:Icc protein
VHCVPGNHDDRELMRETLDNPPFYFCDSVTLGNWFVIGIDSCLDGEAGGRVGSAEMSRLEHALAATSAEHVLVCLHHPPLPIGSRWLDQVGLDNGDEYFSLLSVTGKVRATVFGHAHQAFEQMHDGIRVLGTPSTCRQFKTDSDEFTLDDSPPGYRRITLSPDGALDSELVWVG